MMSRLQQLEIKRLLKELEFFESDFEYKNEIIFEADNNFIKCVNVFLEENTDVKKVFDERINKKIDDMLAAKAAKNLELAEVQESESEDIETEYDEQEKTDIQRIKKIYREIAKKTHPDKVDDKTLNNLYIKATSSYEKNDIIEIYAICDILGIVHEMSENDCVLIRAKIETMRQSIKFMESTYTWKWHHSDDDSEKNEIVINYIKTQIR
jgi:hypothetical protein